MTELMEAHPDPIREVLSALDVEGLKYLAREFHIKRQGRKRDIIHRFLTSFIPLQMLLEALRTRELLLIYKHLELAPLPRNKNEIIEKIYSSIIERFNQSDLLQCIRRKYSLIHPIGEGGQGSVFLARELLTERVVVIKHAQLPEGSSWLSKELRVLASLDHPNIEQLYTYEIFGDCPSVLFLVVEYCGDLSLEKALFRENISFSNAERASIIEQALSGLAYYHSRQIIHGDISTSNILLQRPDNYHNTWGLKFIDFGASRIGFEPITTPIRNDRYTAPEIPRSSPSTSSDVFSLSIVIAEFLSREPLFTDVDQKSNLHFITKWLSKNINIPCIRDSLIKGLHPDPRKRINDGSKLRKVWQPLLSHM